MVDGGVIADETAVGNRQVGFAVISLNGASFGCRISGKDGVRYCGFAFGIDGAAVASARAVALKRRAGNAQRTPVVDGAAVVGSAVVGKRGVVDGQRFARSVNGAAEIAAVAGERAAVDLGVAEVGKGAAVVAAGSLAEADVVDGQVLRFSEAERSVGDGRTAAGGKRQIVKRGFDAGAGKCQRTGKPGGRIAGN